MFPWSHFSKPVTESKVMFLILHSALVICIFTILMQCYVCCVTFDGKIFLPCIFESWRRKNVSPPGWPLLPLISAPVKVVRQEWLIQRDKGSLYYGNPFEIISTFWWTYKCSFNIILKVVHIQTFVSMSIILCSAAGVKSLGLLPLACKIKPQSDL